MMKRNESVQDDYTAALQSLQDTERSWRHQQDRVRAERAKGEADVAAWREAHVASVRQTLRAMEEATATIPPPGVPNVTASVSSGLAATLDWEAVASEVSRVDAELRAIYATLPGLRMREASHRQDKIALGVWGGIVILTLLNALSAGGDVWAIFGVLLTIAVGSGIAVIPIAVTKGTFFPALSGGGHQGKLASFRLAFGALCALVGVVHILSFGMILLLVAVPLLLPRVRALKAAAATLRAG